MLSTTAKTVGVASRDRRRARRLDRSQRLCQERRRHPRRGRLQQSVHLALKVKLRDGRLEVEFEVDQNRNRVPWNVQLLRNGKLAFAGTRTTAAPSGSFSLERRLAAGGSPVIRARATRNGETCTATLTARATAAAAAAATAPWRPLPA